MSNCYYYYYYYYYFLQWKIRDSFFTRSDRIKDLGVFIDSKLYFISHVYCIFLNPSIQRPLGLIRNINSSFSTFDNLLILYFSIVRTKLQYASVVWNLITSTDA
jgi:hypothetical protein